jgi:hypothetical protein
MATHATTIKSTALDFQNIKNNLKDYLEQTAEFKDYNFEASGLSSILDVLAYNTHINALTANFALNESFLSTAQLRSSLISLSEGIGYVPDSKSPSSADIRMSVNLNSVANRSNILDVPAGYSFTAQGDDGSFTFQTLESIKATDDGNGYYQFLTYDDQPIIPIVEGTARRKTFVAGSSNENTAYIIPDESMYTSGAVVRVYESATSSSYTTYTDIVKAISIDENATLYILKELPNGQFELSFGNGTTLGAAPTPGAKITLDYLSVAGNASDNISRFEPTTPIVVTSTISRMPTVSTVSKSSAGAAKESIESIRKNAPYQYASQNRMVTAVDYSALVLKNYSSRIKDIKSWGGEDALIPEYGTVFLSILFEDNISDSVKIATKAGVKDLSAQLAVASFGLKFADPVQTFIETEVFFQFNPRLTTLTQNTIQSNVRAEILNYFNGAVGSFDQAFRRSNLLSDIDQLSPAILSSRADVKMQQRFTPIITVEQNHDLLFPTAIATPDDVNFIIRSSSFVYSGLTCQVRNKLTSNILQVVNINDNTLIIDNVGSYDATKGIINLVGLTVDSLSQGLSEVKISVVPANQSVLAPTRNDVLRYDSATATARAVSVTATN